MNREEQNEKAFDKLIDKVMGECEDPYEALNIWEGIKGEVDYYRWVKKLQDECRAKDAMIDQLLRISEDLDKEIRALKENDVDSSAQESLLHLRKSRHPR